jgi:hypothetical protein
MSLSQLLAEKRLNKVNNGLWWATLTGISLIPIGIATEELIARKMKMTDCNHSRFEIRRQLLGLVTGVTLLGFLIGYRRAGNSLLLKN